MSSVFNVTQHVIEDEDHVVHQVDLSHIGGENTIIKVARQHQDDKDHLECQQHRIKEPKLSEITTFKVIHRANEHEDRSQHQALGATQTDERDEVIDMGAWEADNAPLPPTNADRMRICFQIMLAWIPYFIPGTAEFEATSDIAGRLCISLTFICTLHFTIGTGHVYLADPPRYFDVMNDGPSMLFKSFTVHPLARALAKGMAEVLSKLLASNASGEAKEWTDENLPLFEEIIGPMLWQFCPTWLSFTLSLTLVIIDYCVPVDAIVS